MKTGVLIIIGIITVLTISGISISLVYNQEIKLVTGMMESDTERSDVYSEWRTDEDYCSDWCNQTELYSLGCDKPILGHLTKYSNLLDEEFVGTYYIDAIGLPDGVSQEKFEECVDIIYEMRLPSYEDLNISQVRVENFCTEEPWICYGTFDNGTEIRIACDFPMHGCMKSFDKDNSTELENEN